MNDSGTKNAVASLEQAVESLETGSELARFAGLLFGGADVSDLDHFKPALLAEIARLAYAFHEKRDPGRAKIGVEALETDFGPRRSLLMVANDDMPFLLDSLLGELNAESVGADLIVHPTFKVERDEVGERIAIVGPGDSNWGDGSQESLIVAVVDLSLIHI